MALLNILTKHKAVLVLELVLSMISLNSLQAVQVISIKH